MVQSIHAYMGRNKHDRPGIILQSLQNYAQISLHSLRWRSQSTYNHSRRLHSASTCLREICVRSSAVECWSQWQNLDRRINRSRVTNVNPDQITGFNLWRTFEIVVKLPENIFHLRDPKYGSLLGRLRIGNKTWNDFLTLNTRFVDENDPLSPVHEELAKVQEGENVLCPFATQGNNSRHFNQLAKHERVIQCNWQTFVPICAQRCSIAATRGKHQPVWAGTASEHGGPQAR